MYRPRLSKTALAVAMAGAVAASTPGEAAVLNFEWTGAFTLLSSTGQPLQNSPSDYASGFYPNGDGDSSTFGAPQYPGNVGPGAVPGPGASYYTADGWNGGRTPISGTLSFDPLNGAGIATINDFFFFGDTAGSGAGTNVARFLGVSFARVDTTGTIVGTMLMSWNGAGHSISVVLDGSGFFEAINSGWQPGWTLSGNKLRDSTSTLVAVVGSVLPATDGVNFGSAKTPVFLPLGPTPIATTTVNATGCEALALSTQVNSYTIVVNQANLNSCDLSIDDGIGGSPIVSAALAAGEQLNFDIGEGSSITLVSVSTAPVPVPQAAWLFGTGLTGLAAIAQRRRNAQK